VDDALQRRRLAGRGVGHFTQFGQTHSQRASGGVKIKIFIHVGIFFPQRKLEPTFFCSQDVKKKET
jgi:hypothetical protein